jgi:hypothetical protein
LHYEESIGSKPARFRQSPRLVANYGRGFGWSLRAELGLAIMQVSFTGAMIGAVLAGPDWWEFLKNTIVIAR